MRLFIVINPVAGKGRARRVWPRAQAVLDAAGARYDLHETGCPGDATAVARRAAAEGYDAVVAVGGDGTTFEIANGLAGTGTALGIIAAGTGNDFGRTLGIPADPVGAAETVLRGRSRAVDLGRVGDRHYLNIAGVGFDAEVARIYAEGGLRRLGVYFGGAVPYLIGVLRGLVTYRSVPAEIVMDGTVLRGKVFLAAVGNARYYGGGMMMCPGAEVDDGQFDVVVGWDLTTTEALSVLPGLFRGRHILHPKIHAYRAREVTITSDPPLAVHADGEVVDRTPITFRVLPGAIRVLVPAAGA